MNPLLSGCVLATALALGQTSEPPIVPPSFGAPSVVPSSVPPAPTLPTTAAPASSAGQPPQRGPIISFFMREDRPVLSKITGWFKREPSETTAPPPAKGLLQREPIVSPPAAPVTPASNDYPRRLPNPLSKATSSSVIVAQNTPASTKDTEMPKEEIVLTSAQQPSDLKAAKSPIRSQFANKIGRDEKFEWITGQLEMENGVYVLYYATPETVDKYHGRVVLQPQQVDMKELRRGDLVSVRGQIVERSSWQGSGSVYRLTNANLLERPKL